MSSPRPPRYDQRRTNELLQELRARAAAWLPEWGLPQSDADFGHAVLEIVARLESEVTERLDKVPDKAFRGFLDWVGLRGDGVHAARAPVVFSVTRNSPPIDAMPPIRVEAPGPDGSPVVLEVGNAMRIVPANLVSLVAADPDNDAFELPPARVLSLEAPPALPGRWQVTTPVDATPTQLQLDPPLGLAIGDLLADPSNGLQYAVTAAKGGIVSIDPALGTPMDKNAAPGALPERLVRQARFDAFGPGVRNQQKHELYIGAAKMLNVAAAAVFEVVCDGGVPAALQGATWRYFGVDESRTSATNLPPWPKLNVVNSTDGRLFLCKPAGAMAKTKVGSLNAFWFKASTDDPLLPSTSAATLSKLGLKINSMKDPKKWPDTVTTWLKDAGETKLAYEAISNSTLASSTPFQPLGAEPRLFDAFYLGCAEGFGTENAQVTVAIDLGDGLSTPMLAVSFDSDWLLVGVGADGRLRRAKATFAGGKFQKIDMLPSVQPRLSDGTPVALIVQRLPGIAKVAENQAYVTAAAGAAIWLWSTTGAEDTGTWTPLGAPSSGGVPGDSVLEQPLNDLLRVYAVFDDAVHRRSAIATSAWTRMTIRDGDKSTGKDVKVARIVGIRMLDSLDQETGSLDGIACVSADGNLYVVDRSEASSMVELEPAPPQGPVQFDTRAWPLVLRERRGGVPSVVASVTALGKPYVLATSPKSKGRNAPWAYKFCDTDAIVSRSFLPVSPAKNQKGLVVAFAVQASTQRPRPCSLAPFAKSPMEVDIDFPIDSGSVSEAPVRFGSCLAFALDDGTLWASPFDTFRLGKTTNGVFQETFDGEAAIGKRMVIQMPGFSDKRAFEVAVQIGTPTTVVFPLPVLLGAASEDVFVHELPEDWLNGRGQDSTHIELEAGDGLTKKGDVLVWRQKGVANAELAVVKVADVADGIATLVNKTPIGDQFDIEYGRLTEAAHFEMVPFLRWQSFADTLPQRPTLSWEYFNGSAWSQVKGLNDTTQGLTRSATVDVPVGTDWQATDVAGHKNYWLRARLIGGDYGRESIKVHLSPTLPDGRGGTVQTVERDPSTVHAPQITRLELTYKLDVAAIPDYLLTADNGGMRDQSDANRAANATVEFFVPLSESLARLSVDAAQPPAPTAQGRCDGATGWAGMTSPAADADALRRAIYLGFDGEISGDAEIQLLFMLVGSNDDSAFPLRVESLVGGRFQPVISTDGTRGLSETGVVSFTLGESPQQTTLFGQSLFWLRLLPAERVSPTWAPRILGAYANGAFAVAAQTQRMENLGGSDGSPNQHFTLARTPVLADTLELRVRESLGDDEIRALIATDDRAVVSSLGEWDGPWVLWHEVVDPADAQPGERVYALDDDTGDISFGDGIHGRIPPIGTRAVVAVIYQCGGGSAANSIAAWTALTLVTPLQGVQGAVAVGAAAGGADAQDAMTALRFMPANLRMRGRALGLRDLEVLAMQSTPAIAQARALATGGGVRVVVAVRGTDPVPSAAVCRELGRALAARVEPSLAEPDALVVDAPRLVPMRIDLNLSIATLDLAGPVGKVVKSLLYALFDPASGGLDGAGWRFGQLPEDADVAAQLAGVDGLDGIENLQLRAVASDGTLAALPSSLGNDQLLTVAPNGIYIEFALSGSAVAP